MYLEFGEQKSNGTENSQLCRDMAPNMGQYDIDSNGLQIGCFASGGRPQVYRHFIQFTGEYLSGLLGVNGGMHIEHVIEENGLELFYEEWFGHGYLGVFYEPMEGHEHVQLRDHRVDIEQYFYAFLHYLDDLEYLPAAGHDQIIVLLDESLVEGDQVLGHELEHLALLVHLGDLVVEGVLYLVMADLSF